jgi:hypothetical protein
MRTASVPLARNSGGPIDVPDEANHWRIRRHTGGRPRLVLGVDKQPLRLPLTMNEADLEDVLGPATYRLDLCDQAGNHLDVTVPITIGEPEAREEPEKPNETDPYPVPPVAPLPSMNGELRLVLEAHIRAMSASFQHNERTLTAALRATDSLREGVRVLADAQADWIKSIAGAKGYLRNAAAAAPPAHLPAPPPSVQVAPDEDDEDDEEDEEEDEPPFWGDSLAKTASEVVPPLVMYFMQKKSSDAAGASGAAPAESGGGGGIMDMVGDALNWTRAHEKAKAKRAKDASPAAASEAPAPRLTPVELMKKTPPDIVARLMHAANEMTVEERARLERLIGKIREKDIPVIAEQIRGVPNDKLARYLLVVADSVEEHERADGVGAATSTVSAE